MPYLLDEEQSSFTVVALAKLTLKEPCFWPETARGMTVFFLCDT